MWDIGFGDRIDKVKGWAFVRVFDNSVVRGLTLRIPLSPSGLCSLVFVAPEIREIGWYLIGGPGARLAGLKTSDGLRLYLLFVRVRDLEMAWEDVC